MKNLIGYALISIFISTIVACGKESGNNGNSPLPQTPSAQTRNDDRRLSENDLRQIEALDGKTFGQVVASIAGLSASRSLTTNDLAGLIDQRLNVKCLADNICSFRRKDERNRNNNRR